jgi:hypothetical protein
MDGFTLSRKVRQLLSEDSDSLFINTEFTYDALYEAVIEVIKRTQCYCGEEVITTVQGTQRYSLPTDFLKLYVKDSNGELVGKFYNGSSYYWPTFREYAAIYTDNQTAQKAIPDYFSIIQDTTRSDIASTVTAIGADSRSAESILTDGTASFLTTAKAGDRIINATDGSQGYVVSVTDNTHLVVALAGGTDNDWTNADVYYLIPQQRYAIWLDQPSSTAGYTLTIPYLKKPQPVYSSYRSYPLPRDFEAPIVSYAAFLYKYKDREPNFGDVLYKNFDALVRTGKNIHDGARGKFGYQVFLSKKAFSDRTQR